jgi:hypothetical protein
MPFGFRQISLPDNLGVIAAPRGVVVVPCVSVALFDDFDEQVRPELGRGNCSSRYMPVLLKLNIRAGRYSSWPPTEYRTSA